MRTIKYILLFGGGVVSVLIAIVLFRAINLSSRQVSAEAIPDLDVPDLAIQHLSEAIQIQTITHEDPSKFESSEFQRFHEFLRRSYPNVLRELEMQIVNDYSVLYRWQGSDAQLSPYLLLAHLDVVPIETGTEKDWQFSPFAGTIADGFVWGRGAVDNKANVVSILEAAELLIQSGFKPRRTVYFAFGHDEEANGENGALKIAEALKAKKVNLEFLLDEGLFILRGSMPGVSLPVAYIGIAEKGYLDLELAVQAEPGHSSIPPKIPSAARIAKAIAALNEHPFPASIDGAVRDMFDFVAPEMSFGLKAVFANRWLLEPLVLMQLAAEPTTDAMIRTSAAPTMLQGSLKPNVLPARPSAVINFRILPGETIESTVARVKKVIDDPEVIVTVREGNNDPLPPSDVNSKEFLALQRLIRSLYPGVIVAPSLMLGGTDSKHFKDVAKNIYRFSPMEMTDEDLHAFHGTDEKIGVENVKRLVNYYFNLVKSMDAISP